MRGPTPFFLLLLFIFQLFVAWAAYRLLAYFSPLGRRRAAYWVYWIISLLAVLIIYVGRLLRLPPDFWGGHYYTLVSMSYGWTIGQILFILGVVMLLAVEWLAKKTGAAGDNREETAGISRREFLKGAGAGLLPLVAIGTGARGVYAAAAEPVVNRYELYLPDFPLEHEGIKLAQISDLHIGPFFGLEKVDLTIDLVKREKPDIVVITGDLIDDIDLAQQAVDKLSRLAADIPYGIFFCWGNHEYFRDINKIATVLRHSSIRVLGNGSYKVTGGTTPLYLVGVDYPWAKNRTELEAVKKRYMTEALGGIPAGVYPLFISHHPDFISDAFEAGFPLTLVGHTHGGQVVVLGKPLLPLQYRYMKGFYRQGDQQAYVHSGTGHWLPFRLGCPAEIAIFTLRRK